MNTGHIPFKLNCGYYLHISFKDDANSCSKPCLVKELAKKLRDLISIYQQNLFYAQELQK